MQHELKIKQEYFHAIRNEGKEFEIRWNDRKYKTGDELFFREIDENSEYTGNIFYAKVGYILKNVSGLEKGYCIFVLEQIDFCEY